MNPTYEEMRRAWEFFGRLTPYNATLGMELAPAPGGGWSLMLPYREELIGDPDTGVLHGGAISALLDVACAFAVFERMAQRRMLATLDLRLDYLHPATPGKAVYARGTCYKTTADLAFVRGAVDHGAPDDPIATCVAIYIFTDDAAAPAGDGA